MNFKKINQKNKKWVTLILILSLITFTVIGRELYKNFTMKEELERKKQLFENVQIKARYDRKKCPSKSRPIFVEYKNNTKKCIYTITFHLSSRNHDNIIYVDLEDAKFDKTYELRIIKPHSSYESCTNNYDPIVDRLGGTFISYAELKASNMLENENETEEEYNKRMETNSRRLLYQIYYKEILFSDGEVIYGYDDVNGIVFEKSGRVLKDMFNKKLVYKTVNSP